MTDAQRIAEKRLKRKRILQRRLKCHGNVSACLEEHPSRKSVLASTITSPKKKSSWFSNVLIWLSEKVFGQVKKDQV